MICKCIDVIKTLYLRCWKDLTPQVHFFVSAK